MEVAKRTDEFQVGDGLIVGPLCGGATKRSLYLPRGVWTDMRTGVAYAGRQTIDIEAPAETLPMFAKNGSLFPLAKVGLMRVHYFPKLGGEFFIWEPDLEIISQLYPKKSSYPIAWASLPGLPRTFPSKKCLNAALRIKLQVSS